MSSSLSRREFVARTTAVAATFSCPAIFSADKTGKKMITGEGDYKYEVHHAWPKLPSKFKWQTTHNVAVDKNGYLYVIHEGRQNLKDHPSIFVFDPKGKYVRSFGSQFQGGGHGIEVRTEGKEQFIYVCAYQHLKTFAKFNMKGELVWQKYAAMQTGVYAKDEDTKPKRAWGRNRFLPTNFAFLPDGDFFLADGYGSYTIQRFDKDGNFKSFFGGPGKGEGKFNLPHGIWVDDRPGRKPSIAVCDRAHHTIQYFTLEGKYIETLKGYGLPANLDTYKNIMIVPELVARVTLLNEKNEVVARLGDDVARIKADKRFGIRRDEAKWQPGRFVHPHDACFDNEGNIFVAEWVHSGRVTKLVRLS